MSEFILFLRYTPFPWYRGFHDTAVNAKHAEVQTQLHLPDVDIITPATQKFFFQVIIILAKMSRLLVNKNLKMIKSIRTWFTTFPVHPLSPKTPPLACLQTSKVLFFALQTSSETSSNVIKIEFTVTIFRNLF